MPSGKIISFENGEVSPSLRFRTTLAAFATGLSKLLNKTVRKSGGASNRSGFQYIDEVTDQADLKIHGKVKLFSFRIQRSDDPENEDPVIVVYPGSRSGSVTPQVFGEINSLVGVPIGRDLTSVKMSQIKDTVIFSNGSEYWAMKRIDGITGLQDSTLNAPTGIGSSAITGTSKVTNPPTDLSHCLYRVYQVLKTGEEIAYTTADALATRSPIAYGSTMIFNEITLTLNADDSVKHYNIYRASSSSTGDPSAWGLVGRIPKPSTTKSVTFNDYIETPDFLNPPPEETYLYGEHGPFVEVVSARLVGHYQQRRVIIVNSSTSKLDEGSVALSKVGSPDQMDTQAIFTPAGAFDFKVPVGVKSKIIATMEMERLILLTSDAVIVVRGGEQGVLTPSTVNPLVISYVGCSNKVSPVYAGLYGFYMSKNEEKLMRVSFSLDGNLSVDEISVLSDHLLEGSKVKEMSLTQGKEDKLWLLKYDGTLVSITIHQGGQITGWARHETDGFIESITSINQTRHFPKDTVESDETYDALFCLVVRTKWNSGLGEFEEKRYLERVAYRSDTDVKQYDYVDSSVNFGARLILDLENNRYINFNSDTLENHTQKISNSEDVTNSYRMNIGDGLAIGTDALWAEGEEIEVNSLDAGIFVDPTIDLVVLDFFYEEDGIEKSIRWTQTGLTSANVAPGVFDGDVPTALRDLETVGATDRALQQTRVVRVKKTITGLTHLANKDVSVFADGKVLSSPNNPYYDTLTVDGSGNLELPEYVGWGVVGLPYTSELETLDLDTSDERTFTDAKKLVNRVGVAFEETKGGYIGQTGSSDDITKMQRIIHREDEVLEQSTQNINEHIDVSIPGEWEQTGRVLIKQVDPLPMSVLAVYPKGIVGD